MTFKGMLKILLNDYRKQHEQKFVSLVHELGQTRRELIQVKEQLRSLAFTNSSPSTSVLPTSASTISLFVQFYGFFNELCEIRRSITIDELLTTFRQITGIPKDYPIRLRVLSQDGSETLFFLHQDLQRTLDSFGEQLKPRMILSIENDDSETDENQSTFHFTSIVNNADRTHSLESEV